MHTIYSLLEFRNSTTSSAHPSSVPIPTSSPRTDTRGKLDELVSFFLLISCTRGAGRWWKSKSAEGAKKKKKKKKARLLQRITDGNRWHFPKPFFVARSNSAFRLFALISRRRPFPHPPPFVIYSVLGDAFCCTPVNPEFVISPRDLWRRFFRLRNLGNESLRI